MPGSAANPVVLDPFRTIVEVGWNPVTHVAFQIDYHATLYYTSSSDPCDPPEFSEGSGPAHWTEYLTQIVYSGPPTPPSGGYALRNGNWGDAPDIEISGVPDPSGATGSYGAWENVTVRNVLQDVPEHIGGSLPGDLEWKIENARAGHFTPASGSGTGIELPVGVGEFQTGFTPELATISQLYLGPEPVCFTDGSLNGTARLRNTEFIRLNPFEVPASSFHASWRGKTFTGMAAFVVNSSAGSGWLPEAPAELGSNDVWILCIRDDLIP